MCICIRKGDWTIRVCMVVAENSRGERRRRSLLRPEANLKYLLISSLLP